MQKGKSKFPQNCKVAQCSQGVTLSLSFAFLGDWRSCFREHCVVKVAPSAVNVDDYNKLFF